MAKSFYTKIVGVTFDNSDGTNRQKVLARCRNGERVQTEFAGEYLKKGSAVFIEGRLSTRSYDKEGDKRYVTEVVARRLQAVGARKDVAETPPASVDGPAGEAIASPCPSCGQSCQVVAVVVQ